jgi:hypothetical protein
MAAAHASRAVSGGGRPAYLSSSRVALALAICSHVYSIVYIVCVYVMYKSAADSRSMCHVCRQRNTKICIAQA